MEDVMIIQADEKVIYDLIKKAVSEVVDEKLDELKISLIPTINNDELEEIDSIFGTPENYNHQEFEEMEL